jgi:outer membrane protein assembly factor BamB
MGRSSVIVKGKRLFLTAADQETLMLFAFDSETGKKLWRFAMPRSRRNEIDGQRNDPASPTPATDGETVYAFFQDFGLLAVTTDGNERWKLPLGPFPNNYGMASSPIVYGETVFLQCDQLLGSFIVAADKRTGRVRWRTTRPSVLEGWATPLCSASNWGIGGAQLQRS